MGWFEYVLSGEWLDRFKLKGGYGNSTVILNLSEHKTS